MASNAHFVWNHINIACRYSFFFSVFVFVFVHLSSSHSFHSYLHLHWCNSISLCMMAQKNKANISSNFSKCMWKNLSFHECLKYSSSLQIETAESKFQVNFLQKFIESVSKNIDSVFSTEVVIISYSFICKCYIFPFLTKKNSYCIVLSNGSNTNTIPFSKIQFLIFSFILSRCHCCCFKLEECQFLLKFPCSLSKFPMNWATRSKI